MSSWPHILYSNMLQWAKSRPFSTDFRLKRFQSLFTIYICNRHLHIYQPCMNLHREKLYNVLAGLDIYVKIKVKVNENYSYNL
jgi:hypothetical protein